MRPYYAIAMPTVFLLLYSSIGYQCRAEGTTWRSNSNGTLEMPLISSEENDAFGIAKRYSVEFTGTISANAVGRVTDVQGTVVSLTDPNGERIPVLSTKLDNGVLIVTVMNGTTYLIYGLTGSGGVIEKQKPEIHRVMTCSATVTVNFNLPFTKTLGVQLKERNPNVSNLAVDKAVPGTGAALILKEKSSITFSDICSGSYYLELYMNMSPLSHLIGPIRKYRDNHHYVETIELGGLKGDPNTFLNPLQP